MDLYNLVVSAKLTKGGGGDIEVDELSVTENGVYTASSGHAYSPVTVSVPGIVPSGTSQITSNGVYDVTAFASASVSVPTGVFPSGTSSITANGIYDITNFASVDVNVSGGGGGGITVDEIAMRTISGVISGSATEVASVAFSGCSLITAAYFPSASRIWPSAFYNCDSLITVSLPNVGTIYSKAFNNAKLASLYLLGSTMASLQNSNAFDGTPMHSNYGQSGRIYVPASLFEDYKTDTKWSHFSKCFVSVSE